MNTFVLLLPLIVSLLVLIVLVVVSLFSLNLQKGSNPATTVATAITRYVLRFHHHLINPVQVVQEKNPQPFLKQERQKSRHVRRIHTGWIACRLSDIPRTATEIRDDYLRGCSNTISSSTGNQNTTTTTLITSVKPWIVPKLPTTALLVLLHNNQIKVQRQRHVQEDIKQDENSHTNDNTGFYYITPENMYYSTNLGLIPDISEVGRDFYTLVYEYNLTKLFLNTTMEDIDVDGRAVHHRKTLRISGINYMSHVYIDGYRIHDLSGFDDMVGMFHRKSYNIKHYSPQRLSIVIQPPFHPGTCRTNVTTETKKYDSSATTTIPPTCTGQGGNHELAKDGPIAQYMLGWDWCQSMPDRATGFYGDITIERTIGPYYALLDPTIQTTFLNNCTTITTSGSKNNNDDQNYNNNKRIICNEIGIRILVRLECLVSTNTAGSSSAWDLLFSKTNKTKNTNGTVKLSINVVSDWGEIWTIPVWVNNPPCGDDTNRSSSSRNSSNNHNNNNNSRAIFRDIQKEFVIKNAAMVHLWWPHGIGMQDIGYLHSFTFSLHFRDNDDDDNDKDVNATTTATTVVSDRVTIQTGIRTIQTYLDTNKTQGQVFLMNGYPIYFVGGNWIGTDQALRYSSSKQRYCNELLLHQYSGINLLRVWGGGVSETTKFYQCADTLGIVIYQEFWMTGDNNGRWGGNYSWPYNEEAYMYNVEDTIRRLRVHPSLLFYGGCNECLAPRTSQWYPNPSNTINDGIQSLLDQYDPNRFYIPSSMGGYNKADPFYDPTIYMNRSFSLSYMDGPYEMLLPHQFYERNPGLSIDNNNISIGFQPEIGSTNAPTYHGLLRFMSETEAQLGYPKRNNHKKQEATPPPTKTANGNFDDVGTAWEFHRYQSWTTTVRDSSSGTESYYDHVYAYFDDAYLLNVSEWCVGAQLASYQQYSTLFNGYISHIFDYTTTVILWKSQSPWPSLRGYLYDWYLESTGALRGVKASLQHPVSIVLDLHTYQFRIVNRQIVPLSFENDEKQDNNEPQDRIGAEYTWFVQNGTIVDSQTMFLPTGTIVPAMSAVLLGNEHTKNNSIVQWPNECTDVCFLRLTPVIPSTMIPTSIDNNNNATTRTSTWQWFTNQSWGTTTTNQKQYNYTALGQMRSLQSTIVQMMVQKCYISPPSTTRRQSLLLTIQIDIIVDSNSPELLFYPTFEVVTTDKKPILPLFDSKETSIVLVPGQTESRTLYSTTTTLPPTIRRHRRNNHTTTTNEVLVYVSLYSWNALTITKLVHCSSTNLTTQHHVSSSSIG